MATLKIEVQHIDSILPSIGRHGVVKISCDMEYRDMEEAVAQFREQLTEGEWKSIVRCTQ